MGHQHHSGSYVIDDGIDLGDHPHFHKIKHYKRKYTGEHMVGRTHEFSSPLLFAEMDAEQFLRAFLKNYYFDHTEKDEIKKIIGKQFQSELGKFNNRTEDD
jgi:hypothetical protein